MFTTEDQREEMFAQRASNRKKKTDTPDTTTPSKSGSTEPDVGAQLENSAQKAERKQQEYADHAAGCAEAAVEKERWGKTGDAAAFWKESARLDGISKEYGAKAKFFRELGLLYAGTKGAPKPVAKAPSPMFKSAGTGTEDQPSDDSGGSQINKRTPIRPLTTAQAITTEGISPLTASGAGRATATTGKTAKTPASALTSGTYADRETVRLQIDQTLKERDAYISASGGKPDARVLDYYNRLLEDLYSAMDAMPQQPAKENILLQALGGNYYAGRPTIAGTAAQFSLGTLGLDTPADIRDLQYDLTHQDSIPKGQLALDALAFLPLIGGLKYVNDGVDAAKAVNRASNIAKHTDEIIDTVGSVSYNTTKFPNKEVREWYVSQVSAISESIDNTLPLEEQAHIAFETRNNLRAQAREMMEDSNTRSYLDKKHPNPSFEELIERKMTHKGMTREEALRDIYNTATTTNKKVNNIFGIGEQ